MEGKTTDFYLLTGFLGAGKTTFLKRLTERFPDRRTALVINEFGREGVDGRLLAGLGGTLTEIDNGSIFCACRAEQFAAAVRQAAASKPDLLIVEASGLSDPSALQTLLERPEFSGITFRGTVCLVDALYFIKVYQTASVVKKQLSCADLIVISKTDIADAAEIAAVRAVLEKFPAEIFETDGGRLSDELSAAFCRLAPAERGRAFLTEDVSLRKFALRVFLSAPRAEVTAFVRMLLPEAYRVKGILRFPDGLWLFDCTGTTLKTVPFAGDSAGKENLLNVLSGGALKTETALAAARKKYPDVVEEIL